MTLPVSIKVFLFELAVPLGSYVCSGQSSHLNSVRKNIFATPSPLSEVDEGALQEGQWDSDPVLCIVGEFLVIVISMFFALR